MHVNMYPTEIRVNLMDVNFSKIRVNFVRVVKMLCYIPIIRHAVKTKT